MPFYSCGQQSMKMTQDIQKVKENIDELNSNLDGLEFGEVAGGKNLWDEQWKIGVYTESDGIFSPSFDYFCSKNKIKVKPNTIYRFISPEIKHYIYKYDVNGNYIGRIAMVGNIFSTDNNVEYIQFVMEREYGTTYNHDIAIIEGTSGTYEPYIPSVKMIAEEVNEQNESLDEQGLLNVGDDFVKGIVTWDGNVDFNDALGVVSKNPKPCKAGDVITVKTDKVYDYLYIATWKENTFFDRPSFSGANKEITYIIPDGVTSFRAMIANSSGAIKYANDCMVYINNGIERLKNDLGGLNTNVMLTRIYDAPRCILTDNQNTITSDYGLTYSDLSNMLTNGDYKNYIKNGDYIRLTTLNGEVFNMIFNINTYKDYGDTSVGSHIDLISERLIPSSYGWQMRTENTNNGTSDMQNPYLASTNMINKLNEYFENNIPTELKNHIVTKRLLVPIRYSAEGTLTDDNSWHWADLGKMWLPFEQEVAGRQVWGSREWQGGLRWYPCFQDGAQLVKRLGETGDRYDWWTASASSGNSTCFVLVHADGYITYGSASNTWLVVPLCMRFK